MLSLYRHILTVSFSIRYISDNFFSYIYYRISWSCMDTNIKFSPHLYFILSLIKPTNISVLIWLLDLWLPFINDWHFNNSPYVWAIKCIWFKRIIWTAISIIINLCRHLLYLRNYLLHLCPYLLYLRDLPVIHLSLPLYLWNYLLHLCPYLLYICRYLCTFVVAS